MWGWVRYCEEVGVKWGEGQQNRKLETYANAEEQ